MKKLLILVIAIFTLTGCSSYTELNDLSIVSMMGIDYNNDTYKLTIQVIEGKIDDNEVEKNITTYLTQANSIEECFNNIYKESKKRLYLSHIDLLVLSSNAINYDLKKIISHFLRNNEYRNNFNIVLTDSNIEELMNNENSTNINNLLKTNSIESGIAVSKDFEKILDELLIDSNTYLPTIKYENNHLLLAGYTIITNYKTDKLLSEKESILFNLLTNQINKTYLNNTNILDNQTQIKINKNIITFKFIMVIDSNNNFIAETKKDLKNFLNEYYQNNNDILKLKEKIRKNNYTYFKNNNNLLEKLKFNFEFEIKVKDLYFKGDDIYEK